MKNKKKDKKSKKIKKNKKDKKVKDKKSKTDKNKKGGKAPLTNATAPAKAKPVVKPATATPVKVAKPAPVAKPATPKPVSTGGAKKHHHVNVAVQYGAVNDEIEKEVNMHEKVNEFEIDTNDEDASVKAKDFQFL